MDTIDEGWVKLHRKIIANPIFKDSEALHLFSYLLLKANHKMNRFPFNRREIVIDRGQLITGWVQISKATGLTRQQIRNRLELLKNLEILTIKTTNKFSIITICNYDYYQGSEVDDQPPNQPSSNHQATTNKNDKNDKNKKIYVEGSDELRLSTFLLMEIQKNKPDFKQPNLQSWAKEVDLMLKRDGRKPERIRQVIKWCQSDSFWRNNILSTSKLRKQFDTLEMQMDCSKKTTGKEGW